MNVFDIANNLKPGRKEQRRNGIPHFSRLMLFVDASLKGYQHPSAHRAQSWGLYKNTPSSLRKKKKGLLLLHREHKIVESAGGD